MEIYFGTKDNSAVSIPGAVRRKHMAVFGKSGVGKTMAFADVHAGNGLTVIDPHGGLVRELLEAIPRRRIKDVVYIDASLTPSVSPASTSWNRVASSIISILRNLYPDNWGP